MADPSEQFSWLNGVFDWYQDSSIPQWGDNILGAIEDSNDWATKTAVGLAAPYFAPAGDRMAGQADMAATIGQNAANMAVQGVGAIPATAMQMKDPNVGFQDALANTTNAMQNNMQQYGRQPSTGMGQYMAGALSPVGEQVERGKRFLGDTAQDMGASPELSTALYMAPELATMGAGRLFGGAKPRQFTADDLFPQQPRLGGRAEPFNVEGITGRGGPGKYEEGAVKITNRDPLTGKENYERMPDGGIAPIRPLYVSPKMDSSGKILDVPENKYAETPLFTSVIPTAMSRTDLTTGTPDEWAAEFKKIGVPQQELMFTGIQDRLNNAEGEKVTKSEIIDAYNTKNARMETWNTGAGVDNPLTPEVTEAKNKAENQNVETIRNVKTANTHIAQALAGELDIDQGPAESRVISLTTEISADMERGTWKTNPSVTQTNIPDELWTDIISNAKDLTEARTKMKDARRKEQYLANHPSGPYSSSGGVNDEYMWAGSYTIGGDRDVQGPHRGLFQAPKELFSEDQKNFHSKHWGESHDEEMSNLTHSRWAPRPVMNAPTFFDEAGDEWRPTTAHGDEPYQGDAGARLKVEGMPGWDPTNRYGGLAKTPSPALFREAEKAKTRAAEGKARAAAFYPQVEEARTAFRDKKNLLDTELRSANGTNARAASNLWGDWPTAVDRALERMANRLGFDRYSSDVDTEYGVAARVPIRAELDSLAPNGRPEEFDEGLWQDYKDQIIEYHSLKDTPDAERQGMSQEDLEALGTEVAQLRDRYRTVQAEHEAMENEWMNAERESDPTKSKYILHENMPMVQRGSGGVERQNVGIMSMISNAYYGGHEFVSFSTMRQMAESYGDSAPSGYSNVGPEPEALERFQNHSPHTYTYDPRYNDWFEDGVYTRERNVPADIQQQLRENTPSFTDYTAEGKERWAMTQDAGLTYDEAIANWDQQLESTKERRMREMGMPEWEDYVKGYSVTTNPAAQAVPYDTPMNPITDPEAWEFSTDKTPREMRSSDLTGNAKNTYGAAIQNFKDPQIVNGIKRVLRDALGLSPEDIAVAMGDDVELRVGDSRRDAPHSLVNRKVRSRGFEMTPAVKKAFENRTGAGLFGTLNPPPKAKPAGPKPNPGKIQKAYAQNKISKEEAIEQLKEAGVPERAIQNMIGRVNPQSGSVSLFRDRPATEPKPSKTWQDKLFNVMFPDPGRKGPAAQRGEIQMGLDFNDRPTLTRTEVIDRINNSLHPQDKPINERSLNYYIAEGLLPKINTRGPNSLYPQSHVDRALEVKRLQREGHSLADIKSMQGGTGSPTNVLAPASGPTMSRDELIEKANSTLMGSPVNTRTINHWRHEGLLPKASARGPNTQYPASTLDIILKIRELQSLGKSIPEIKRTLNNER